MKDKGTVITRSPNQEGIARDHLVSSNYLCILQMTMTIKWEPKLNLSVLSRVISEEKKTVKMKLQIIIGKLIVYII